MTAVLVLSGRMSVQMLLATVMASIPVAFMMSAVSSRKMSPRAASPPSVANLRWSWLANAAASSIVHSASPEYNVSRSRGSVFRDAGLRRGSDAFHPIAWMAPVISHIAASLILGKSTLMVRPMKMCSQGSSRDKAVGKAKMASL